MTTLLARAADLRALATQAVTAADAGHEEAAIRAVGGVVERVDGQIAAFGVASQRWLPEIGEADRARIRELAESVAATVATVAQMDDVQLAACGGNARDDSAGTLAELTQRAERLATVLREAHAALAEAWAERVWPAARIAELDVLARIPDHAAPAAAVGRARNQLLLGRTSTSTSDLERLDAARDTGVRRAAELTEAEVPEEVVRWWQSATSAAGSPLAELSPAVLEWLTAHDATDVFVVITRERTWD